MSEFRGVAAQNWRETRRESENGSMRVPGVGNNPGYGRGPQAEKTNKDAPRKQQQHQQPGKEKHEEDSVELHQPKGKPGADPAARGKQTPPPKPSGGNRGLDVSG